MSNAGFPEIHESGASGGVEAGEVELHINSTGDFGHARVDAAVEAVAAIEGDHSSVVKAGHIHRRLNGVFQITNLVDQMKSLSLNTGVNSAVGQLADLGFGQAAS